MDDPLFSNSARLRVPATRQPVRHHAQAILPLLAGIGVWFLLCLTALGRGGEAAWAEGLALLAGALGAAAFAIAPTALPRPLTTAALLWLLLCLWCWLQSLPLPALAHPVWGEAAAALPAIGGGSIALDPYAARGDALRLMAYAGLFALGMVLARSGYSLWVLAVTAAPIALFTLAALALVPDQQGFNPGKVRHAADAVFPFTNRNTFCAFAGAGLTICLAVIASGSARVWPYWLCMAVVCAAGVIAAHSRAGMAATIIGCVVALLLTRPPRLAQTVLLASIAGLAVLSLFTLTGLRLAGVWQDLTIRLAIWQASANIAQAYFWQGLGSLDQALQIGPVDWGNRHILRAHNIYLQAVAERGFPATVATIAAILLCVRQALRTQRSCHPPAARASKAAALGVLALFASHGLVDFSLYAPINAAIMAILLGLACGNAPRALPRQQAFATNAPPSPF
jgi:O-antigen ligase